MGIPYVGGLAPNRHCTLDTAPLDVLATLGPLMQRINIAVKSIPGVARTHFARWGDGSEHFHLWALARPEGMMQGRGPMLAFWDDVLPAMPDELMAEHLRIVAENLAAGGGTAFPPTGLRPARPPGSPRRPSPSPSGAACGPWSAAGRRRRCRGVVGLVLQAAGQQAVAARTRRAQPSRPVPVTVAKSGRAHSTNAPG